MRRRPALSVARAHPAGITVTRRGSTNAGSQRRQESNGTLAPGPSRRGTALPRSIVRRVWSTASRWALVPGSRPRRVPAYTQNLFWRRSSSVRKFRRRTVRQFVRGGGLCSSATCSASERWLYRKRATAADLRSAPLSQSERMMRRKRRRPAIAPAASRHGAELEGNRRGAKPLLRTMQFRAAVHSLSMNMVQRSSSCGVRHTTTASVQETSVSVNAEDSVARPRSRSAAPRDRWRNLGCDRARHRGLDRESDHGSRSLSSTYKLGELSVVACCSTPPASARQAIRSPPESSTSDSTARSDDAGSCRLTRVETVSPGVRVELADASLSRDECGAYEELLGSRLRVGNSRSARRSGE